MIKTSFFHVCWIENLTLRIHNSQECTHTFFTSCLCTLFLQSFVEDLQLFALSTQALLCDQAFSSIWLFLKNLVLPTTFSAPSLTICMIHTASLTWFYYCV